MAGNFCIGGAKIYADNMENCKVLPMENDLYVIEYNGIKIKFPEQSGVKANSSNLTSCIFMEKDRTAIRLTNPIVEGSAKDDKVNSYCVGGVFNFKFGGKDDIKHYVPNDSNYSDEERKCKFNINEEDIVIERHYDAVMNLDGRFGDEIIKLTNHDNDENNTVERQIKWN